MEYYYENPVPTIPVVILKIPRSGARGSRPNSMLYLQFIFQRKLYKVGMKMFSTPEIEAHLIAALRGPMGKLSQSRQFLPDARYIEDYLKPTSWAWKPATNLQVIGFSVNPEHIPEVNWARIKEAVPELRVAP